MKYTKKVIVFIWIIFLIRCSVSDTTKSNTSPLVAQKKGEKTELFISAAASLTDALEEIKAVYEKENSVKLILNFGGSGKLAQQIQQGAPVDFFLSANEYWMNQLIKDNFIEKGTVNDITGNKLVLNVKRDSKIELSSFENIVDYPFEQIAIGNPESVQAGKYTEETLISVGIRDVLEHKMVFAQNERQVLIYVETGNTVIGFVYESDALSSEYVKILTFSDSVGHEPIIYQGALTAQTELNQAGMDFMEFLLSSEAQAILEKYGFGQ